MESNLWKNFRFTRFFASMTISSFGDWLDIIALQVIFVHEFHASPVVMGSLAFLYFIPAILLGPFAGVVADRYSKRNIMMTTDALSAGLTLGLMLSHSAIAALSFIVIRSAICSLSAPSAQAYIKQIVPVEHLLQATSYTTISFQFSKMLAPILGSMMILVAPARVCLGVNSISFIVSFLILLKLPVDFPASTEGAGINIAGWFNDIKHGGVFVWNHSLFRIVILLTATWFFCSMVYNSQLAIFLKHILPLKTNVLGYMIGLEGIGAVLAGVLLSRRKEITNYFPYFSSAFLLIGIGTLGIAYYQASWPLFFLYVSPFIRGIGGGLGGVVYSYLLRKESPDKQIGCIVGISSATQSLSMAIGTLLSGFLIMQFGTHEAYLGLSVIMFVLAVSALFLLRKTK